MFHILISHDANIVSRLVRITDLYIKIVNILRCRFVWCFGTSFVLQEGGYVGKSAILSFYM